MNRQSFLRYGLVFISALFTDCNKSTISNPEQPRDPSHTIFPLAVGNRWIVQTTNYDSTGAVVYTQQDTIRILRDTTIQAERWYIGYGLLTNRADGLYDYQAGTSSPVSLRLKYPVSLPSSYVYRGSPVNVLTVGDTMSVQAGTFACFGYRIGIEGITYNDEYYSPGVGLVKRDCYNPLAAGGVYKYLQYELVSYQLQ